MRLAAKTNSLTAQRIGFTILEVLIALTASLLMMLALTRAFKLIGDRITQSQSELELSGTLRDVTFALRDELNHLTIDSKIPQARGASSGYLTYYEGPWTEGTTSLINSSGPQTGYLPTSRYGDLDDYFAYTAKARPDSPFVGMIPRGVLESHRYEQHLAAGGTSGTFVTFDGIALGSYTIENAFELVPFYSEFAEVAYFCTPVWQRDNLGQPIYDDSGSATDTFYPLFVDVVNEVGGATPGDNLPDRLTLRRRVLLIRPDLNMTPRRMYMIGGGGLTPIISDTDEDIGQLPILLPSTGGSSARVRPLAMAEDDMGITPPNKSFRFEAGPWNPTTAWPGVAADAVRPPWLTGVIRVQQLMDLSVARITNDWSTTGSAGYGMPADTSPSTGGPANLTANSLTSLTRPENRFAHVRMPLLVGGERASSMPILALSPPHPYLSAAEAVSLSNGSAADDRFGQAVSGSNPPAYGNFTMVGFARPELSLTDYVVADRSAPTATAVPTYRGGTDVVAADVIGFDVRVFDPHAPNFVWLGSNAAGTNVPGLPGDDDGDNAFEELDEVGLPGTDDAVVSVNSAAIYPVAGTETAPPIFTSSTMTLPAGTNEYLVVAPGEFVDYGFTRLSGGPFGGYQAVDRLAAAPRRGFHNLMTTNFSGMRFAADPGGTPTYSRYPTSWSTSGRFVFATHFGAGGTMNSFVQPVIDTWTESYDGDGFEQNITTMNFNVVGSVLAPQPNQTNPVPVSTRYWRNSAETAVPGIGFEDGNTIASQSAPPTPEMPRALKVSLRVYDRTAMEIRQQSVVHEFDR